MGLPKQIILTDAWKRAGIDVTYIKSRGVLEIGGWYDQIVGIETRTLTLREFFEQLGIDRKAVMEATK